MSDMYLQFFNTIFILANMFYVRHASIFDYNVYISKWVFISDMYLQYLTTMFILANGIYVRHVSTIFQHNVHFSEKGVMLDMYLQYHNTVLMLCLFWQVVYVRHIYIQ